MPATLPYLPRAAFVFDFDKTLAGDSIDALLDLIGMDRETWQADFVDPLGDGWDPILRRGLSLVHACAAKGRPLTRDLFAEAGERIERYKGVMEMPDRLREICRETHSEIETECVILSSGFEEFITATEVPEAFDAIHAGSFHYHDGVAHSVRHRIDHPEKALHLRALAQGASIHEADAPGTGTGTARHADHDWRVLPDQMVYCGDGLSDLQAFGWLESAGGLAIAVDRDEDFAHEGAQAQGQRVENLAPPDYSEGSELMESLECAARSVAARIALRARGKGE